MLGLHFVGKIITSTNMTSLPENFEPQHVAYFLGRAGCLATVCILKQVGKRIAVPTIPYFARGAGENFEYVHVLFGRADCLTLHFETARIKNNSPYCARSALKCLVFSRALEESVC